MPALDPNTPPIGRQPALAKWTPSAPFLWYGSIVEGERFTQEQHAQLIRRGLSAADVPTMTVKRQAKREEHYWPFTELPPVFAFECPIIGKRGDKVKVIAPNGDAKLVAADGWAHRPYRIPRDMWGVPS